MAPEHGGADRDRVRRRRRDRAPARARAGGAAGAAEHRPDAAGDGDLRGRAQHHDLRRSAARCCSIVRDDGGRRGIRVVARDEGRASRTSSWRCRTATPRGGGLGLGLPGARRLVDEFDIETAPGRGHDGHAGQVGEAPRSLTAGPRRSTRRRGLRASRARTRSGDLAVFAPYARGGLAAVIDGLGHGADAADAAEASPRAVMRHARAEAPPRSCSSAATQALATAAAWS